MVVAGPNGAGKTTFAMELAATAGVEFVNADEIAAERWPGKEEASAYEAAAEAAARRSDLIAAGRTFATETVFSHRSKVDLVRTAAEAGYAVGLHVVMVPEDFAVRRVQNRVAHGGHSVPEAKIRARYRRLWALVSEAAKLCDETMFYDNTSAERPFRLVAEFRQGVSSVAPDWPVWAPPELMGVGAG